MSGFARALALPRLLVLGVSIWAIRSFGETTTGVDQERVLWRHPIRFATGVTQLSVGLDEAGNVYAGSLDGGVYAFDRAGNTLWRCDAHSGLANDISVAIDTKGAVAAAGCEARRIRAEALPTTKGGLRALYRTLELPGANPLKDAHAALDTALLAAYGFDPKADLLAQLLALNRAVANRIEAGESVTAPGIPATVADPAALITSDCIRPAG